MSLPEIILIAVGLSMDAFAVSVTLGLSVKKPSVKEYLLPGIYFGVFQALMPLAGFFAGVRFADRVQSVDHWIASILLGLIGGKMIVESLSKDDRGDAKKVDASSFRAANMLLLAVATSIDALAVGVTFAFFQINILPAIAIIGLTTCAISVTGVKIGSVFGAKFKSKAEFIGGATLVGLGVKILAEHLFSLPP